MLYRADRRKLGQQSLTAGKGSVPVPSNGGRSSQTSVANALVDRSGGLSAASIDPIT
jgi:hypothetical protein